MPTTSSESLYDSVGAFTESGFAHASDTRPAASNFNRIISEIRIDSTKVTNILNSVNPLIILADRTSELRNAIKSQYPQAADDLVAHYAVSLYLAEKIGSPASALLGLVKETFDVLGTGFSFDDLGANFAGFAGLSAQEAFDGGFLTRQQFEANKSFSVEGTLLGLMKKVRDLMDPTVINQSTQDRTAAQSFFTKAIGREYSRSLIGLFRLAGGFFSVELVQLVNGNWQTVAQAKTGEAVNEYPGFNISPYTGTSNQVVTVSYEETTNNGYYFPASTIEVELDYNKKALGAGYYGQNIWYATFPYRYQNQPLTIAGK